MKSRARIALVGSLVLSFALNVCLASVIIWYIHGRAVNSDAQLRAIARDLAVYQEELHVLRELTWENRATQQATMPAIQGNTPEEWELNRRIRLTKLMDVIFFMKGQKRQLEEDWLW